MRNEDDGEGEDDEATAEARSHVFERNYRGLGRKESSPSQNSAHQRCECDMPCKTINPK